MKKSKILAVFAAIAVAVCIGLFAGCGGNYSETYNGALSEQSYTSEENAAKAFLTEEVAGEGYTLVYSKVEVSETALSEEEVAKLEIEDTASVEYVKKATVYFTEGGTQALAAAAEGNSEMSQMLYIVKYVNGGFKYYSPALSNGENLTKSYFNDVFNPERYANVTVTGKLTSVSGAKASYEGETMDATVTIDMDYTYQVSENAVYVKLTQTTKGYDETGKAATEKAEQDGYLVSTDKGYVMCAKRNGVYQISLMSGIENGSDLVWGTVAQEVSHTDFKKTNTGFEMDKDACIALMQEQLGDAFKEYEFGSFEDLIDEMQFNFYVTNGNISGLKEKLSLGLSINEQGMSMTVTAAASADFSFKNFGSTTVNVPNEVKTAIQNKGYTIK